VVTVDVDVVPGLALGGEDLVLIVKAKLDEAEKKMNANNVRSINFFMLVNLI